MGVGRHGRDPEHVDGSCKIIAQPGALTAAGARGSVGGAAPHPSLGGAVDDRFADLDAWHDFFTAVAGVAATLVGLLFVALALNPAVMADDAPTGLRTWA